MKKNEMCERICAYCENGKLLIDGESAVCKYKGAVSMGYSCKKFIFDPLKVGVEPKRLKPIKVESL